MKTKKISPDYGPSTVKRALSILFILKNEKDGLRMMDLATKLNLNRSTVYRLVSALTESGMVKQDPATQRYSLGLKLIELAGHMLAEMKVREVAQPFLQKLMQISRETVHLGILERGEVVYIDKIDGPEPVRLLTHVGKALPAYVTSMGKAIMAYLPEEELEEVLNQQSFEAITKNTITNKQAFRDHLKLVRSVGYATDHEENRPTACCLGAPVFDFVGKVIAAVSVSGPSFRLTPKRMRELSGLVKSTASEISKSLGYQVDILIPKIGQNGG